MKNCVRKTKANTEKDPEAKEEEAKTRRAEGGRRERRTGNSRTIAAEQRDPAHQSSRTGTEPPPEKRGRVDGNQNMRRSEKRNPMPSRREENSQRQGQEDQTSTRN